MPKRNRNKTKIKRREAERRNQSVSEKGNTTVPEVVRMARRVRARCPNDVRAREETTSGAVVVLAKGDVTDRTGDDDFKKRGKT